MVARPLEPRGGAGALALLLLLLLLRCGDVETNPGPNPGVLTHLELYHLAELMDREDFWKAGLALGLSDAALRRAAVDRGNSTLEAAYCTLVDWLKTMPESQARSTLVSALRGCKLEQLAEKVERGLVQDLPPHLTREEVIRCQEDLKTHYRTYLCRVRTDPLDPRSHVALEDTYCNLELLQERSTLGTERQKVPLEYHCLLTTKVDGKFPKRLLVQGEGGSGKTTLCAKIASDWITGVAFQEFELVMVVPLKQVRDHRTVGGVVKTYLSDHNPIEARQIDEYILANPEKVFLIFDGLDEHQRDISETSGGGQIEGIMRGDQLKSCTVLVTSRPWKVDQIRLNLHLSKVYTYIDLKGFSKENLSAYVRKFFASNTRTAEELLLYMEESTVVAGHMSPFPIYAAMLCTLWQEWDADRREAMWKLQTFAQLFQEMILFLVDHYIAKKLTDLRGPDLQEQYDKIHQLLLTLGNRALKGLQEHQMTFLEDDFRDAQGAAGMGCKIGVLTQEARMVRVRSEEHLGKRRAPIFVFSFHHKFFQEYLAGKYLASLFTASHQEYESLMENTILQRAVEFRYLLYFASCQQSDVGVDIVKRMISGKSRFFGVNTGLIMDVAFESQDPEVVRFVQGGFLADVYELKVTPSMSTHTLAGYLHIFQDHPCTKVQLKYMTFSQALSRSLAQFICHAEALAELSVNMVQLTHHFIDVIRENAVRSKVEILTLANVTLDLSVFLALLALPRLKIVVLRSRFVLQMDAQEIVSSCPAKELDVDDRTLTDCRDMPMGQILPNVESVKVVMTTRMASAASVLQSLRMPFLKELDLQNRVKHWDALGDDETTCSTPSSSSSSSPSSSSSSSPSQSLAHPAIPSSSSSSTFYSLSYPPLASPFSFPVLSLPTPESSTSTVTPFPTDIPIMTTTTTTTTTATSTNGAASSSTSTTTGANQCTANADDRLPTKTDNTTDAAANTSTATDAATSVDLVVGTTATTSITSSTSTPTNNTQSTSDPIITTPTNNSTTTTTTTILPASNVMPSSTTPAPTTTLTTATTIGYRAAPVSLSQCLVDSFPHLTTLRLSQSTISAACSTALIRLLWEQHPALETLSIAFCEGSAELTSLMEEVESEGKIHLSIQLI